MNVDKFYEGIAHKLADALNDNSNVKIVAGNDQAHQWFEGVFYDGIEVRYYDCSRDIKIVRGELVLWLPLEAEFHDCPKIQYSAKKLLIAHKIKAFIQRIA